MSFCACNGHCYDLDGVCVLCDDTRDIPVDTLQTVTVMNARHRQIIRTLEEVHRTRWWQFERKRALRDRLAILNDRWTRRYGR